MMLRRTAGRGQGPASYPPCVVLFDVRMDLIRGFGSDEFSQALESWRWIGIEGKTLLFCSPFGDVSLRAADGIWWLDTVEGTLTRRWAHSEELKAALRTT